MRTKSVDVSEASGHLSQLLDTVERGEEVEIMRRGVVVARLVPALRRQRTLGLDVGRFEIPDDFDEPLPAEERSSFER